jgi:hypothetical protein
MSRGPVSIYNAVLVCLAALALGPQHTIGGCDGVLLKWALLIVQQIVGSFSKLSMGLDLIAGFYNADD